MRLARKIYQRYLVRETLAAVGLVLLAFIALFAFFDFIEELRGVGRDRYGAGVAVLAVLLSMPGLIYELLPVACKMKGNTSIATATRPKTTSLEDLEFVMCVSWSIRRGRPHAHPAGPKDAGSAPKPAQ